MVTRFAIDQIAAGIQDTIAYAEGATDGFDAHIPAEVDVRSIRRRMKLSQPTFARTFGFSLGRIHDWEQHRSPIDQSSRVFLTVIEREPDAVRRALAKSRC